MSSTKSNRRPKGFAEWNPAPHVAEVLDQVNQVLDENSRYGALTARQVFYMLVGQFGYDKTERAYQRLTGYLVRARRAGMVPFESIRDDGTVVKGGGGWDSRQQFWRSVRYTAEEFRLDRQRGQEQEIELWCEAAGMAPMLARMVREYSIPVYSTGGFSSVTVTHEVAERVFNTYTQTGQPTVMLHVGDYDPSGESIFESMSQDIGAFVSGRLDEEGWSEDWDEETGEVYGVFEPFRAALHDYQVSMYSVETAPPKPTDSRTASWGGNQAAQLEALRPETLEEVVLGALEDYIDEDAIERTKELEQRERKRIMDVLRSQENA